MTTPSFNINALVNGTDVRSVRFGHNDDVNHRTDTSAPYTICAAPSVNDFAKCGRLGLGTHIVVATPRDRNGQPTGPSMGLTFSIVKKDEKPPKLINVQALTPTTVDVSNGQAFVDLELTFQDDASGVEGGLIQYGNSSVADENFAFTFGNVFLDNATSFVPDPSPTVNVRNNDPVTYVVRMRVRQFQTPGVYPLSLLFSDRVQNFDGEFTSDELAAAGFPSSITIVNSNAVDTTPMQLLNLTALTPLTMDVTDPQSFVEFEIVVQDDLSGIDRGVMRDLRKGQAPAMTSFFGKGGPNFIGWDLFNHDDPELPAGLPQTIRFNLTWEWDGGSAAPKARKYPLYLALFDGVRNFVKFNSTELKARGFPSFITAVNPSSN